LWGVKVSPLIRSVHPVSTFKQQQQQRTLSKRHGERALSGGVLLLLLLDRLLRKPIGNMPQSSMP
jgi:phosphopantetheinyl transferase